MRHIISPTDLNLSELNELLSLAEDIIRIQKNTLMHVVKRSWQPYSMNQAPEQD